MRHNKWVILESANDLDGHIQRIKISQKYAKLSRLVSSVLEGGGSSYIDSIPVVQCKQVPRHTLEHIATYLKHHKGKEAAPIPKPIPSTNLNDFIEDQWDVAYINSFSKKQVYEIILAANYLDIQPLLHLGSAKIAVLIKGQDSEEIKRILNDEEQPRAQQRNNTKYNQKKVDKCSQCECLRERIGTLETEKHDLKSVIDDILNDQMKVTKQNETLKGNELVLKKRINSLQKQNIVLTEECKETKMELNEWKNKYNELNRNIKLDEKKYYEWSTDDFIKWILLLDDGRYKKYEKQIQKTLYEEQLDGSCIHDIEKNDIKGWGIAVFKDRTALFKHIQNLFNAEKDRGFGEGSTAYI